MYPVFVLLWLCWRMTLQFIHLPLSLRLHFSVSNCARKSVTTSTSWRPSYITIRVISRFSMRSTGSIKQPTIYYPAWFKNLSIQFPFHLWLCWSVTLHYKRKNLGKGQQNSDYNKQCAKFVFLQDSNLLPMVFALEVFIFFRFSRRYSLYVRKKLWSTNVKKSQMHDYFRHF